MIPKDDRTVRGGLFMHELFHRIHGGLGLSSEMPKMAPGSGENAHLDSLEGRYWMRLEWRALARALGAFGAARISAIADARAFRAARHQRFPGAAADEHADGPVLVVPRAGSGMVNNMGATVIPGAGTVYRALATKTAWGFFDAKDGAMISADGDTVSLPAPVVVDATTLKGDGWTATVGPGWIVQPGPRPGDYQVVRQQP